MDEWAILMVEDADAALMLLYDSGTKAQMEQAFLHLVTDGREECDFYLVKVVKQAIQFPTSLQVSDLGEDE